MFACCTGQSRLAWPEQFSGIPPNVLVQACVSSEIEASDDGKVVGGGFVASLGGVLGDRGGLAGGGVDVLDVLDEGVTDEDVVDQLAAAAKAPAVASLFGDQRREVPQA